MIDQYELSTLRRSKEKLDDGLLSGIYIPQRYNYIAAFLTLNCNLKCSYCINNFSKQKKITGAQIPGRQWVRGLNRIISRKDLPVTLQGGEPSIHPDFIWIINNIKKDLHIDILTNLQFNVYEFISKVDPERLRRDAPYHSIRVSYHPESMDLDELNVKVKLLMKAGFGVGIYGIMHPYFEKIILDAEKKCQNLGIDFRTKEFLGEFNNSMQGAYLYPDAVTKSSKKKVLCRTSELLIAANGGIYRCHHDLYEALSPIGSILDTNFQIEDKFRACKSYGYCNVCDIKIKTNRFQKFGHTSVEIKRCLTGGKYGKKNHIRGKRYTKAVV